MDNFPIGGSKYPQRAGNFFTVSFKGSNSKWSKFEIKRIAFPGASIVIHDISSKDCRGRRWNSTIQGETWSVPRLIRGKSAPVVKLYHRGSKWNWGVRSWFSPRGARNVLRREKKDERWRNFLSYGKRLIESFLSDGITRGRIVNYNN